MQKRTITLSSLISAVLIVPTLAIAMPTDASDSSPTTHANLTASKLITPVDNTLQKKGIHSNQQPTDDEEIDTRSAEVEDAETTVASASEAANISQDIVDEPSLASQELEPLPTAAPVQDQQLNRTSDQTSPNTDTTNAPVTLQETRKIIVR